MCTATSNGARVELVQVSKENNKMYIIKYKKISRTVIERKVHCNI